MEKIRRLSKDEILAIPQKKISGMTHKQIADEYGVGHETIAYWVRRLRAEGFSCPNASIVGRKPIALRD